MTVQEKLDARAYYSKLPYYPQEEYTADAARLENEFKKDALEELGLTNHPKANVFASKLCYWIRGDTFYETWEAMQDLAGLLQ